MGPDCTTIHGLLVKLSDARNADRTSQTQQTRQPIRGIQNKLLIARAVATQAICDQYTWEIAKEGFTLHELRNGHHRPRWTDDLWPTDDSLRNPLDHAEYYCFAYGPRFPAAIVSHEFGPFEDSQTFAEVNGLIATRLQVSWYDPVRAIAVAYTSPLVPFPPVR